MKNVRVVKWAGALALASIVGTSVGWAGTPPPSELAARWWTWVLEIPKAQNPLLDDTGQFAGVGQSGPVWFLAGTWGGGPATRAFTVPAGKPLFFPIANFFSCGHVTGPKAATVPPGPIHSQRELAKAFIDTLIYLECDVDGVPVPITAQNREQSVPFAVRFPAYNLFMDEAFTCSPGVDEGYYVLLAPPTKGQHVIHFAAAGPGFTLDVTDYITVK